MSVFVPQESDRPAARKLVYIGIGWIVVATLGVLSAYWILRGQEESLGASAPQGPPAIAPPAIGVVDQTQIRDVRSPTLLYLPDEQRLHSWGWVDRERGVAHIPIEVSMRLMLGEEQP